MKKPQIIGAGIIVTVFALFFVASPFVALNGMKSAVIEQDSEKLTEMIDFTSVRQSIKDQVNASMAKELASSDQESNPFAALGAMFAASLVDGMVNAMVTPVGLQALFSGSFATPEEMEETIDQSELLKNVSFKYNSLSKFTVSVKSEDTEEPVKLILRREGLSWKLSEITIPM